MIKMVTLFIVLLVAGTAMLGSYLAPDDLAQCQTLPSLEGVCQKADAVVMVVRWRRTPRMLVLQALKQLRIYGAKVAGVVVTQANLRALAASEGSHAYVHRKYGSYLR